MKLKEAQNNLCEAFAYSDNDEDKNCTYNLLAVLNDHLEYCELRPK